MSRTSTQDSHSREKVIHIDALPLYKKYTNVFSIDDVPEAERKAVGRRVADQIIEKLKETPVAMRTT